MGRYFIEFLAVCILSVLSHMPWPYGNVVNGICIGLAVVLLSNAQKRNKERKRLKADLESAVARVGKIVNKPI